MAKKTSKVKIDKERCKGCVLCVSVCPQKALEMAEEVNKKGHQFVVMKDPDKCTGCGLCFVICPDCSIEVLND